MEQTVEARRAMWQQFLTIPHQHIGGVVKVFRDALTADPDYAVRALVHLAKTSKIRDLQDAAITALLQADSGQFPDYREAGRAMLLGGRVYQIEPEGWRGVDPYRVFRTIRFLNSPVCVLDRQGNELGRFRTATEAQRALARLSRRALAGHDPKWRPSEDDTDKTHIEQAGAKVQVDTEHVKAPRLARRLATDYLMALESNPDWWDAVEIRNGPALRALYQNKSSTLPGFRPSERARQVVFENNPPADSKRAILRQIANSEDTEEQLELVQKHRIDYRILQSVLPDTPAAKVVLVAAMTPTQARNARGWLEQSGILEIQEVKRVYLTKLVKAKCSVGAIGGRRSTKGKDAEVETVMMKARDEAARESGQPIVGNVAIIVDRSGSMAPSIAASAHMVAVLTPLCQDKVAMVFHDNSARMVDVTGLELSQIEQITSRVHAGGTTSHQSALRVMERRGFQPNKIVLITDGGENRGDFARALKRLDWDVQLTMIHVPGDRDALSENLANQGLVVEKIELPLRGRTADYLVYDQVAALLGGPAVQSIVDHVMDVEIPRITGRYI